MSGAGTVSSLFPVYNRRECLREYQTLLEKGLEGLEIDRGLGMKDCVPQILTYNIFIIVSL